MNANQSDDPEPSYALQYFQVSFLFFLFLTKFFFQLFGAFPLNSQSSSVSFNACQNIFHHPGLHLLLILPLEKKKMALKHEMISRRQRKSCTNSFRVFLSLLHSKRKIINIRRSRASRTNPNIFFLVVLWGEQSNRR